MAEVSTDSALLASVELEEMLLNDDSSQPSVFYVLQ